MKKQTFLFGVMLLSLQLIAQKKTGIKAETKTFKTSCVSWCFHGFELNEDPEPAIDTIGQLGFDGIQLMICYASDLDTVWTPQKIERVRQRLLKNKLELTSISPFFPVVVGFGSNNDAEIKQSLKNWERCCVIAQKLGTKRVELVGPFMSEFTDPTNDFFNNPYFAYKIKSDTYQAGQKLTLTSPQNTDYATIQTRVFKVLRQANEIAKKYGLIMLLEPHFNSVIPSTDSFTAFWQTLKDKNIKLNTDTGWSTMQCEYPPMNIYKMKDHLDVIQFRDVDNTTRDFVPMGKGVVNLKETLKAIHQIKFKGWLSFEEVRVPTVKEDAKWFLDFIKK
jgi:sugar phosphate isomerase/epimerase